MKTYLSYFIHIFFLFLIAFFFIFKIASGFIFAFFLYVFLIFLYRKNDCLVDLCPSEVKEQGSDGEEEARFIFSPIEGEVIDIDEKVNVIIFKLKMPFFAQKGIFLPCNCSLEEKTQRGLKFKISKNSILKIDFKSFLAPYLWILPYDRGLRAANIGTYPVGGCLTMHLSGQYEVLVQKGEKVLAGETLLCLLKEN